MCQLGFKNKKIKITFETIFHSLLSSVPTTQRHNDVEVSGGVCGVVSDASPLRTPQNHMGRRECTVQAVHCTLLSLHHVCNLTHTKSSERRKRVGSNVYKDSDYWGMKINLLDNIFRVSPMVMIPVSVSNDNSSYPTTVKSRTKTKNLDSGGDFGKYRAPHARSISTTAALNNYKDSPPTGVLANTFFFRKEINAEEIAPLTVEVIATMSSATKLKKQKYNNNNYGGSDSEEGITAMTYAAALGGKEISREFSEDN